MHPNPFLLNKEGIMNMNTIISALAAEGIPALILQLAINASGHNGAARLTTALSSIGPGGMRGGLVTLGAIQVGSFFATEALIEMVYIAAVKQMISDGASQEEVYSTIESYNVSTGLKTRLYNKAQTCFAAQQEGCV